MTNGLQNKIWYADLVGGSLQWQHIDPDTSIWFIKADVNADGSRILVGATSVIDPDDLTLPWFAYLFDGDGKLLWKGELAGLGDTEPYINLEPIIKFADPEGSRFYATNREKVYYYRVD